jgi:hypothetical protein
MASQYPYPQGKRGGCESLLRWAHQPCAQLSSLTARLKLYQVYLLDRH